MYLSLCQELHVERNVALFVGRCVGCMVCACVIEINYFNLSIHQLGLEMRSACKFVGSK